MSRAAALGGGMRVGGGQRSAGPTSMPTIRVQNPAPRQSPAGISGSANVNNGGWNANVRGTVGNANRNAFVEVGASGGFSGRPSGSVMAGAYPF